MPSNSYLAVDLGAESGRVIVGVLEDGRLTLHEAHRFLHRPVDLPSGLHWDLTGLWHNILEGIRAAVIDKDRNPRWAKPTLGDVTDEDIAFMLAPPPGGDLTF